jgi:putative ABC transport system permease protein
MTLPRFPILSDAIGNTLRRLSRTVLTGVGTLLGVAAFVATVGLVETAGHQVNSTFDALRATQVSFSSSGYFVPDPDQAVTQVAGAVSGGAIGELFGGSDVPVRTVLTQDPADPDVVSLPVNEATPGALTAMDLTLLGGRSLTAADQRLTLPVAVVGAAAAQSLNLGPLASRPVVFIGATPVTVVGIAAGADRNQNLLTGIIVTQALATRLAGQPVPPDTVIVTTRPGAAQQVGRQEPLVLSPNDPGAVQAQVPPDPDTLRKTVTGPVQALAILLAGVTIVIGVLSIGNVASLSVIARTQEIGVRRAVGGSRRDIFTMILTESLFVGGLSGLIGSATGVFVVSAVSVHQHWEAVLNPAAPLLAPLLGALTGLLAGLIPAYRATRITPAEALRSA